jgi:homoserine kinase type II
VAVYTDLTDAELEAVLSAYDLGAPRAFKGIAEGVSNSNFMLETDHGRYFLTIFEHRYKEEELPFFLRVMERLAEQDFPAPRPMHARDGGFFVRPRGKPAIIVSFLPGVSPKTPTVAHCRSIGRVLALLHIDLANLDATRANALGPASWPAMVTPKLDLADRLRPGLGAAVQNDLTALARVWPSDLPRGVIHADLFPDNSLFLGNEVSGVIDFYFACTDFLAYDLAVCLNAWCFNEGGVFDLDKGEAMIAAYERIRPLEPEERANLHILARGAAMRFFATRLTDWTETRPGALVRPKDPLEYADKLAFHRTAKSAKDYGG